MANISFGGEGMGLNPKGCSKGVSVVGHMGAVGMGDNTRVAPRATERLRAVQDESVAKQAAIDAQEREVGGRSGAGEGQGTGSHERELQEQGCASSLFVIVNAMAFFC